MESNPKLITEISQFQSIAVDTSVPTLNQIGFVRGKTDRAQYFQLVTDAYRASKLPFNETIRDYLWLVVYRFSKRADMLDKLDAADYLRYVIGIVTIDKQLMQDVADICLQYIAFFPERTRERREPRSFEYVANTGAALYQRLARESYGKDDVSSKMFQAMESSFMHAALVLRSTIRDFTRRREVGYEAGRHQAMNFLRQSEARNTRLAVEKFCNMYFVGEEILTPKSIN